MSSTCKACGTPITWRMYGPDGKEHACKREAKARKTDEQIPLLDAPAKAQSKVCKYCLEPIAFHLDGGKWRPVDPDGSPHLCGSGMPPREPVKAATS